MTRFLTAAERAQARGDFPLGQTPAELVASAVGPLFYRRWFSKEPVDQHFCDSVMERLT